LKRGKSAGSFNVAFETASILRMAVRSNRWHNAKQLIELIKTIGKRIRDSEPFEFAIGNTVRRVLYLIREAYTETEQEVKEKKSPLLQRMTTDVRKSSSMIEMINEELIEDENRFSKSYTNLKANILEAINDWLEEFGNLYVHIADQALEHIHANEVIMTFGKSRTVMEFLKVAARKRKFEVIVADAAPSNSGQETAVLLAQAGIETTLITDSAIFAMMARVNKVIVGTHAVMANGGLVAFAGTHMLAQAAKHQAVPFVVCTGLYKLSPLYPNQQDTFCELKSPQEILSFEEANIDHVSVRNPAWDYIPPELVSLYITNMGGHNPSYIYRLLAELYHTEDIDLS